MWMKRNICKECWGIWMQDSNPSAIGGVFSGDCEICGKRNHDDIFISADEGKIKEIKDQIDARREQLKRLNSSQEDNNEN